MSTKIGSASADKPSAKRRQLEAVVIPESDKYRKAPGPRKSAAKPSAGGTKTQTKTAANATRPVKDKGTPRQKPTQDTEGPATKGPTQRVIRRVHAVIEVPIKVEDEEEELSRTPIDDRMGKVPSDRVPKPQTTVKKTTKPAGPPRTKSRTLQAYRDDEVTPPAPASVARRRKSGIDQDYYEPDEDIRNRANFEDSSVRHRPPSRRKSIRELKESDFEYHEDEEEVEDTDADELNIGVRLLLPPFLRMAELYSFLLAGGL